VWQFFSGGVYEDGELLLHRSLDFLSFLLLLFITPDQRETRHNMLALLAGDQSAQVRTAFIHMLVAWMTRLHDRWDHENRLLPYLLNGLTDAAPALREVAFGAMEQLGATHEDEKENNERDKQLGATHEDEKEDNERDKQELRDFREYGHKTPAELNAAERWNTRGHEPPFSHRPRLGARMVVRNSFRFRAPATR
ncbi:hypothetical protein T484DRAFT_1819549, partial [Baffinella frigidus]